MNTVLAILISLSGMFLFNVPKEHNLIYTPQLALFVLSAGFFLGKIIFDVDRYVGILSWLVSFNFFRTIIGNKFSKFYIFESYIILLCGFLVYYGVRKLKPNKNILRYFLIPAWANIIVIFIQKLCPNLVSFLSPTKILGLLGNAGFTAAFIAATTALFIRYCKYGLPFLVIAIYWCKGFTGFLEFLASVAVFLYLRQDKKILLLSIWLAICSVISLAGYIFFLDEIKVRLAYWAATLSGIMHHPVLGWGIGSYVSVFARIPASEKFLGITINSPSAIVNHPHNELLFGWWNFGILFPVLVIMIIIRLVKDSNKDKVYLLSILSACAIGGFFSIYTPALLLLMLVSLGIYDNLREVQDART